MNVLKAHFTIQTRDLRASRNVFQEIQARVKIRTNNLILYKIYCYLPFIIFLNH